MSAADKGAKAGDKLDQVSNTSYHEAGYKLGGKLDEARNYLNENYKDSKGKTPEEHFKELYGGTVDLAVDSYNYAWSWVPFTKQKAHDAKEYAKTQNYNGLKEDVKSKSHGLKEDAKSKGHDYKEFAKKQELPGDTSKTLGDLINDSRGLVGKFIDTAIHYIEVGEKKVDGAAENAKAKTDREANGLIDRARGLAAYSLETTKSIIIWGTQKAEEAKQTAEAKAGDLKNQAGNAKDSVVNQANYAKDSAVNAKDKAANELTNGDRPHFEMSVKI